jgi:hypothetical protein
MWLVAISAASSQRKPHETVAVTVLTLTNTGTEPTTRTLTAASPIATMPAGLGSELTGTVTARHGPTTIARQGTDLHVADDDAVTIQEEERE